MIVILAISVLAFELLIAFATAEEFEDDNDEDMYDDVF